MDVGDDMMATVSAASPLAVLVDGAATAVSALALGSYTPTLADRVLVVVEGSRLVVLGTVS